MKRVCIVGNSHMGAIVQAFRGAVVETALDISFMGAAWPAFNDITVEDGSLRGLTFELGSASHLLSSYDAFVVYGGFNSAQDLAQVDANLREEGFSNAVRQAAISALLEGSKGYQIAKALSAISEKPVFALSNNPKIDQTSPIDADTFTSLSNVLRDILSPVIYIPFPDQLTGTGAIPKAEYYSGSSYIDGSRRGDSHTAHDLEHMNVNGGALVLKKILSLLENSARPDQAAASLELKGVEMEELHAEGVRLPYDADIMTKNVVASIRGNYYESNEARVVQQLLPASSRVLELGSGLGVISTICARQSRVTSMITIEANPRLQPYLSLVHKLNGVDEKVTRLSGVAMAQPPSSQADFYIRNDFWSSSLSSSPHGFVDRVQVPVFDLNKIISGQNTDLLILDIEGGEVAIFDNLDLGSIKLVMMEIHQYEIGRRGVKKVFDDLSARGFHYEQFHSTGHIVTFSHVDR